MPRTRGRPPGHVALARALSKLGVASRAEASRLVASGRVQVDGRVVRDPTVPVVPERAAIAVDGRRVERAAWAAVVLNKPRGVVTTRRDPDGRPTVFDLVADAGSHLVAVGRLDLATTGLLLLTSDTRLADWLTDPANGVARVYTVTARGELDEDACARLRAGIVDEGERLRADEVTVRKRSRRETHLVLRLSTGRNREVRRLFAAVGHEVTRLSRVAFGGLELGDLPVGAWRTATRDELGAAFPGAPIASRSSRPAEDPAVRSRRPPRSGPA
jgi:23S rRNA pseudouridine2605 synthase